MAQTTLSADQSQELEQLRKELEVAKIEAEGGLAPQEETPVKPHSRVAALVARIEQLTGESVSVTTDAGKIVAK